jgi:hypothetical protein
MRLRCSRRLALSVGLFAALGVASVPPIAAATVSTLSGETLSGSSTSPTNFGLCPTVTYTISGTASGAYPGTFVETGTVSGPTLTAHFSIASAGTTVTGSLTQGSRFTASCGPASGGYHGDARYTATISTASGIYHDEGTSTVDVDINTLSATLTESFTSSLAQTGSSAVTPAVPSVQTLPAR